MKFTRIAAVAVALLFMAVVVQNSYAQSIPIEGVEGHQKPQSRLPAPEKEILRSAESSFSPSDVQSSLSAPRSSITETITAIANKTDISIIGIPLIGIGLIGFIIGFIACIIGIIAIIIGLVAYIIGFIAWIIGIAAFIIGIIAFNIGIPLIGIGIIM